MSDEALYRKWAEEHTANVYRYFRYNVGLEQAQAEDLTQRTFIAVWESMDSFEKRSRVQSWILGIARNIAQKHFRTLHRKNMNESTKEAFKEKSSTLNNLGQSPENLLEEKQKYEQLHIFVRALSDEKREVFQLRYIQQLSIEEIVDLLGVPKETIRSRLRHARNELKQKWSKYTGK